MTKVIKVPKVPPSAFNRSRPASDLLRRQVEQLGYVAGRRASGIPGETSPEAARVRTEAQAAAFIRQITAEILPEAESARAAGAPRRVPVAVLIPTPPKKRSTRSARASARPKSRRRSARGKSKK